MNKYRLEFHRDGGGTEVYWFDTWRDVEKIMSQKGDLFIRAQSLVDITDDVNGLPKGKYKDHCYPDDRSLKEVERSL